MESIKLLEVLRQLPSDDKYNNLSIKELLSVLDKQKSKDIAIETSCGVEAVLAAIFENRGTFQILYQMLIMLHLQIVLVHYTSIILKYYKKEKMLRRDL